MEIVKKGRPADAAWPPARRVLARAVARRRELALNLAGMKAARRRLANELASVAASGNRIQAVVAKDATGLVDRLRRGLSWRLSDISGAERAKVDAPAVRHQAEVGAAALAKIDEEVAALEIAVAAQADAVLAATDAALQEHAAATFGAGYAKALAEARLCMARLEALDQTQGRPRPGRLAGEMPGFTTAGHDLPKIAVAAAPADVSAGAQAWQALREAWSNDPYADPDTHLRFASLCDDPTEGVPYEAMSPAERHAVDARRQP